MITSRGGNNLRTGYILVGSDRFRHLRYSNDAEGSHGAFEGSGVEAHSDKKYDI